MFYGTKVFSTMFYGTKVFSTMFYGTKEFSTMFYGTKVFSTMFYGTKVFSTMFLLRHVLVLSTFKPLLLSQTFLLLGGSYYSHCRQST